MNASAVRPFVTLTLLLASATALGGATAPSAAADRHFIVFAARSGLAYDGSGPAFVMLLKTTATGVDLGAVGIHEAGNVPIFGPVPSDVYDHFLREPTTGADVMLRLEITRGQYEKSLQILRTWERRARENELLYADVFMNNLLFVKQAAEGLNCCGGSIALYALDWGVEDTISEYNTPSNVPFKFFKELRRLNESRHVRDADMPSAARPAPAAAR